MARRQRKCYLCGESYKYCNTCSQDKTKPSWMNEFHSESCKDIFDICTRYNMGLLTKDQARAKLEKCDISNKESFKSYVQQDLENIFAEDVKTENNVLEKSHEVVIEKRK